MEQISYKLPVFEGPLDLLLHLISKNKVNICDVRISDIFEQYMEHINLMQENKMEVTGEFLEMASRLVYIKTVYLLPKHEDEAEELEKELVGQLLEYQICKAMAEKFALLYSADRFVREPEEIPYDPKFTGSIDHRKLASAALRASGNGKRFRPVSKEKISALVSHRIVSVSSKIFSVMKKIRKNGIVTYESLFEEQNEKSEMIATFLAVLELVRSGRLVITDTSTGSNVEIKTGR